MLFCLLLCVLSAFLCYRMAKNCQHRKLNTTLAIVIGVLFPLISIVIYAIIAGGKSRANKMADYHLSPDELEYLKSLEELEDEDDEDDDNDDEFAGLTARQYLDIAEKMLAFNQANKTSSSSRETTSYSSSSESRSTSVRSSSPSRSSSSNYSDKDDKQREREAKQREREEAQREKQRERDAKQREREDMQKEKQREREKAQREKEAQQREKDKAKQKRENVMSQVAIWQYQIQLRKGYIESEKRDIANMRETLRNNPGFTKSTKDSYKNRIEGRQYNIKQYQDQIKKYQQQIANLKSTLK